MPTINNRCEYVCMTFDASQAIVVEKQVRSVADPAGLAILGPGSVALINRRRR
jgi:hypothetical protein